ncbi:hypothetical protein HZB90_04865, partial [archaeon]|nr:hypothetical protein [archaeon]
MERDLNRTNFDPRETELITGIRSIVAETEDPEQLRLRLEERVADIDEEKAIITLNQTIGDGVLESIGNTFGLRFIRGPIRREYVLLTKCGPCADSGDRRRIEGSKRKLPVTAEKYIREAELNEALDAGMAPENLDVDKFNLSCPQCGSMVEITSTSNIMYPPETQLVSAIA